jgi:hypothetical protein
MFDFSLFEGLKYDLAEIAFWGAISDFEYIAVVLIDARRTTECGWHIIAVTIISLLQLSLLNAGNDERTKVDAPACLTQGHHRSDKIEGDESCTWF